MMVKIIPATEPYLDLMLPAYLAEMGGYPFSPPATQESVDRIKTILLERAEAGDPVLMALTLAGSPMGMLMWYHDPLYDKETLAAMGTYVVPMHRGKRVASMLRAEGCRIARERGYKRIVGTVHPENKVGIQSVLTGGWDVAYHAVVKELDRSSIERSKEL